MLDVLPKLLTELRDDSGVDAIVAGRVRGFEPAPDDLDDPMKAFVVLTTLSTARLPGFIRGPVQDARINVRCYGRTAQEAASLYGACVEALHDIGPRLKANGLLIFATYDETGGSQGRDPDDGQPYMEFVVQALATTQVVTA